MSGAGMGSRVKWLVLALVFAATCINYIDRQIIALLKPLLEEEFGWSDRDYGHMVSAFQFAAAAAYLGAGWFVDRVGLRWGYALAVGSWSLAAMAHAAARTVMQFTGVRILLGIAEAANTPAAVKSVAVWFPLKERSFALGIMNSAPNIGAVATPLIVPWLALEFGWEAAFIITGAAGLVWLVPWLMIRQRPEARRELVENAPASASGAPVRWSTLLRDRRTWAIAGGKFLTDQVWWFLLFWMPDFFRRVYGLDLQNVGVPLATVYALAATGALAGGLLPSVMLARGASVNTARKTTLLICALIVTPIPLVLTFESYWSAVLLVGIALAAHQGFSTNLFSLATDAFPARVVGSVIGIGALFGNLGGLLMLEFTGWLLASGGTYLPLFVICAFAYLAALLLIQLLVPVIRPPVEQA